jgi:hypothetical protein
MVANLCCVFDLEACLSLGADQHISEHEPPVSPGCTLHIHPSHSWSISTTQESCTRGAPQRLIQRPRYQSQHDRPPRKDIKMVGNSPRMIIRATVQHVNVDQLRL